MKLAVVILMMAGLIERVVKGGPIGQTVDVVASASGASCGLELGSASVRALG